MIQRSGTTAEELLALPNDGHPRELVRGALRRMTPAGFEHGRIVSNVHFLIARHVRKHGLGAVLAAETGFTLCRNPDTVRAPDVSFVRRDRVPPPQMQRSYAEMAPDLVVEVVSPSDTPADVADKLRDYLAAGVRLIWVVHPESRFVDEYLPEHEVGRLGPDHELTGHQVLPGFCCRVTNLFT